MPGKKSCKNRDIQKIIDRMVKVPGTLSLIFNDVKGYLKYGDLRGVYDRELSGVLDILTLLEQIKEAIDADRLPAMNDLWRLNQKYGEALYFGQYVAEVFANIQY